MCWNRALCEIGAHLTCRGPFPQWLPLMPSPPLFLEIIQITYHFVDMSGDQCRQEKSGGDHQKIDVKQKLRELFKDRKKDYRFFMIFLAEYSADPQLHWDNLYESLHDDEDFTSYVNDLLDSAREHAEKGKVKHLRTRMEWEQYSRFQVNEVFWLTSIYSHAFYLI